MTECVHVCVCVYVYINQRKDSGHSTCRHGEKENSNGYAFSEIFIYTLKSDYLIIILEILQTSCNRVATLLLIATVQKGLSFSQYQNLSPSLNNAVF